MSCNEEGGCGAVWRTRAKYVAGLPDSRHVGVERRVVPAGARGRRVVVEATPGVGRPAHFRVLRCEQCGEPGRAALTHRNGRLEHRDGCGAYE